MPGVVKLWTFTNLLKKDKQPIEKKNWGKTKTRQPQNTVLYVLALLYVLFFPFQKSRFFFQTFSISNIGGMTLLASVMIFWGRCMVLIILKGRILHITQEYPINDWAFLLLK